MTVEWYPLWYIPILPGLSAWKQSTSGVGTGVGGAQSRECEYTAEEQTTARSPVPLHTSWLRYILVTKHIFTRSSGTLHCSPSRPPTVSHSTPSTCRRGQRVTQGLRRPSVNKSSNKNSLFKVFFFQIQFQATIIVQWTIVQWLYKHWILHIFLKHKCFLGSGYFISSP